MEVKRLEQQTKKKDTTQKPVQKLLKDLSKYVLEGRKICYCQATRHGLINNCISCGKIVCVQEGEGPCLFCGAWVDRELSYDVLEDEDDYKKALAHRNKLIDFDRDSAKRLGVLDERSDWYDLTNNQWLNKEQRQYAQQMVKNEKIQEEENDAKVNVRIDLEKMTTSIIKEDTNKFSQNTTAANKFMMDGGNVDDFNQKFNPLPEDKGMQFTASFKSQNMKF